MKFYLLFLLAFPTSFVKAETGITASKALLESAPNTFPGKETIFMLQKSGKWNYMSNDTFPYTIYNRRDFDHIGNYKSVPPVKSSRRRNFDHIGNYNDTSPMKVAAERRTFDHIGNYSVSENILALYPNPTTDKLNIRVAIGKQEKLQLKILDQAGRMHKQETIIAAIGSSTIECSTMNLPNGVYYIYVFNETINECRQFIKR